jgi:transcriptional regulator of NAD metabolism
MLAWLGTQRGPAQGGKLARHFRVSRQCVVQDIAILRAAGNEILATPQGYRLPQQSSRAFRAVDHGVRILDVLVEHPVYGELRGSLMIESRADLQDFLGNIRSTKAALLSSLTQGVHLHTVEASREEMISRAKAKLRARGFLLK